MQTTGKTNTRDAGIRLAGATFLLLGAALIGWLFLSSAPAHHARLPLAFLAAAAGFTGMSFGAVLLTLGRHVDDEVEVSSRWVAWPAPRRPRTRRAAERASLGRAPTIAA